MRRVAALLVCAALWACVASAQTLLRVYFFDVGQGDAVLIQSPSGANVLYDGGDSPSKIAAHLNALGVTRLDIVVASHNHADHIGGLAEVITRFRPRFYMDNGLPATTLTYRRVLEAVHRAGAELLEPTDRQIRIGDEAALRVLPPSGVAGWDQNDNVVGLVLTFGEFRLSLGGDAERRQWTQWVEQYPELLGHVQVHKASHHGSSNGDTAAALYTLSPDVVIISAGRDNGYGHPSAGALRLYAERGSTTFRTDVNGTVLVEAATSGGYRIRVERGEGARPTRHDRPPGEGTGGSAPRAAAERSAYPRAAKGP